LLHGFLNRVHLPPLDEILDSWRIHKDLQGRRALPVQGGNEPLRNNGAQVQGELEVDLRVPFGGEEVHDPLNRLIGVVGMEGSQAEMAGLGKGNGGLHRFGVADLTNQDDIRRLAQRVLQRRLEGVRVKTHLSLRHDRFFVPVNKLNRVFNGHNMHS